MGTPTRNTGKPSQELFEDAFKSLGKKAFLHRFRDKADLFGLNKRSVKAFGQPADYLVTHQGMHFAEVKSTSDQSAFRFSLISDDQWKAASMTLAAGGDYVFYVHRLPTNEWFRISAERITHIKILGKESIKWNEMKENRWEIPK